MTTYRNLSILYPIFKKKPIILYIRNEQVYFIIFCKKKKQQSRFKRGRYHCTSNENYIITSIRCYYREGGTMIIFPGITIVPRRVTCRIEHSSMTGRFYAIYTRNELFEKGERWHFPVTTVRRK